MGNYDIHRNGTIVGKAKVVLDGLYYDITCSCQQLCGICKITLFGNAGSVPLGTCVPDGNIMSLRKRIPVKHIGAAEQLSFQLINNEEDPLLNFTLVEPGQPFSQITKLRNARLVTQNGQTGLLYRCE